MPEFKQTAILVAGMHRSGTSALTRVFSLLGADLPKRLAPALPNNNETGFWESVDLMVEHDALLESAGSFWSDWTEFNPAWYASTEAFKYKKIIADILQTDFADSSLFVIKDPRICRFLPFWLSLLEEQAVKPFIIIPVRNPLEVAQSLKKRDGFPLSKGGLLWLRHVLDAVYYAQACPTAFLSYEQLMQDWQGFVQSMQQQIDLAFPRQSVLANLEIEAYLEEDQKHNSLTLADLKQSSEFSAAIVQAYEYLMQLVAGEQREQAIAGLLRLRLDFNQDSALYAKVLLAEEQLNLKQRKTLETKHLDYVEHLKRVHANDLNELKLMQAASESALQQQDYILKLQLSKHTQAIEQLKERQKHELALQHKRLVERSEQAHQLALTNKRLEAELTHLAKDRTALRNKVLALSDHQTKSMAHPERAKKLLDLGLIKPNLKAAKVPAIKLIAQSGLLDVAFYQKTYLDSVKLEQSLVEHYYFIGAPQGYDPNPLFRTSWYQQNNPDLQVSAENPLVHYLTKGVLSKQQTHPLFDVDWYLEHYADVREDVEKQLINPLWHYLRHGGQELRNPNALFLAAYYVAEYPEVKQSGLSPLAYYLQYGHAWHMDPHPLFDSRYYVRQVGGELPEGSSALEHYLLNPHTWRIAPSACFDGAWYLAEYQDVDASHVNPLVHYLKHGYKDGRKPHPKSDQAAFVLQYQDRFRKAGIQLPSVTSINDLNQPTALVNQSLEQMMLFTEQALRPASKAFTKDKLVIHWVTCDFARQGGGGNMTIFRFVRLFELFGHQQHIWLHNQVVHQTTAEAYEDLVRHYQPASAQIHFIDEYFSQASGDIIIATDWESVWPVLSASGFKRRFYFVQDHEPSFFATGSQSLAAEMTYHEDLDCICAGPWLAKLMRERYGRWATHFWLAADQLVYYPATLKTLNPIPKVAFYARTSTSRRAVELGVLALNYLAESGLAFHVEVYGGDNNAAWLEQVSFSYTDHGVLSAESLGHLYRACDVGMVFSATNYSLVPQEMMACNLAVLELDGENTRTILPTGTVVLAKPHPRSIADCLQELLENKALRDATATLGGEWARQFDWQSTAGEVNQAVQQRLIDLGYQIESPAQPSIKVSVVIPTLNGGKLLGQVVDRVLAQQTPWPFELLIIDSGSTDGSIESLKASQVKIHAIPKTEFSHGGTRNLGVELTSGEYVAFLTQDALPTDAFWLFHLVSVLEHDPQAAGAFGKHLAYPEASAFVKRDLDAHFKHLAQYPLYLDKDTDRERFDTGEAAWRQVLHFYSDNNSCLRRSVWKQIPYPVIEYGEDQVWADLIIKAGYKKAYAPHAVVYHSHDYNEQETLERSQIEASFFYKQFGYILLSGKAAYRKTLQALNTQDTAYAELNGLSAESLKRQLALNEARLKGYLALDFSA
ncbi:MAG: glycosyltransferase [Thiothrix sp.]|nr:MAG: glycosyltransferase [Thiothrix sp.]